MPSGIPGMFSFELTSHIPSRIGEELWAITDQESPSASTITEPSWIFITTPSCITTTATLRHGPRSSRRGPLSLKEYRRDRRRHKDSTEPGRAHTGARYSTAPHRGQRHPDPGG